jgi:8-oxo-dGTP pyrophosphatase MutT (NUDIX family)
MKWKKLNSKIVYKNRWLLVREDSVIRPDGKAGKYSVVERLPVNFIIALDHKDRIFFIREYRYPIKKTILQLPAGTTEKNDSFLVSAKKGLCEETGIKANTWEKIGKFYIGPGHENVYANVFLAKDLDVSQLDKITKNGDELILKILRIPIKEVKQLIVSGRIECGITLAALNLFFTKKK